MLIAWRLPSGAGSAPEHLRRLGHAADRIMSRIDTSAIN
jgi:hypothetical protein